MAIVQQLILESRTSTAQFRAASAGYESCTSVCAVNSIGSIVTRASSRGPDFFKDAWSDTDTSLAVSDDECPEEPDGLASVRWHLELMNTAAEETNAAQNALSACVQEKQDLLKQWAVTSVRLSRSVGVERFDKAIPWLQAYRACRTARTDVAEASEQYKVALEAGKSENEVSDMMARHARALTNYLTAEHTLCQVQQKKRFSPARVAAIRPYTEAEDEHGARMADIHSRIKHYAEHLNSAKRRYRKALKSLEDLSEKTHQRQLALQSTDYA